MRKIMAIAAAAMAALFVAAVAAGIIGSLFKPASSGNDAASIRAAWLADVQAQATATAVAYQAATYAREQQASSERGAWLATVGTIALLAVIMGGAAAVLLALAVALDAYVQRRRPMVQIYNLPHSRQAIIDGEYNLLAATEVQAQGMARIAAAQRGGTPASLNYHDGRHLQAGAGDEQAGEPVQVAQSVPTFAALLDNGTIRPNAPVLRGYDGDGKPIMGNVGDLLSMIVAGVSGSGKGNTTAVLLTQAYLAGAAMIVCDPHSEADEDSLYSLIAPLADAFITDVATDDDEILAALQFAGDVLAARLTPSKATPLQRARAAVAGDRPLLIVVDEANRVLARSTIGEQAASLLETIFSEGRKARVFAACIAQTWLASRSGGNSALRDTAASKYVHRLPRASARLLLPTDLAPQCEHLATGAAVMASRSGDYTTVTMPRITAADIIRAAAMMAGGSPASAPASAPAYVATTYRVASSTPATATEAVTEVVAEVANKQAASVPRGSVLLSTLDGEQFTATGEQVQLCRELLQAQATHSEQIRAIFGVTARGGEQVQIATRRLRALQAYIAR